MTLTEFLLARIAEDEAGYRAEGAGVEWLTVNGRNLWDKLLADCEAKRRIVEDWKSLADRIDDQGRPLHLFDPVTSMLLKATEPWIRSLALPYADHPDYREEWKP